MKQKKVAIMQPYLFPYLGYFQLIQAVDVFVFYDDVNFIKQGWINRNNLLQNGNALMFSVPLRNVSSFDKINEVEINEIVFKKWQKKFWKTIEQNYSKAPYYEETVRIIEKVFSRKSSFISEIAINSIVYVTEYLNLNKEFKVSSKDFSGTILLTRSDRIIEITNKSEGTTYINASDGSKLYEKRYFTERGITLNFIENDFPVYRQFSPDFIKGLSIIDVLMFNDKETIKKELLSYTLV